MRLNRPSTGIRGIRPHGRPDLDGPLALRGKVLVEHRAEPIGLFRGGGVFRPVRFVFGDGGHLLVGDHFFGFVAEGVDPAVACREC